MLPFGGREALSVTMMRWMGWGGGGREVKREGKNGGHPSKLESLIKIELIFE